MSHLSESEKKSWSIEKSSEHYHVEQWGDGYFAINEEGHLGVLSQGVAGPSIDLCDVAEELRKKKVALPCLIRFQDLIRSRVKEINETFRQVMKEYGYGGQYTGVYPVKVNQMREVVEEVLAAGQPYHYGLEAGSKAELLSVLAMNTDPEALTICNGYKDQEYMRLALMGRKIGRKVFVVIEKPSELPLLLDLAEEMGVEPLIGLRARLSSTGSGKWEGSIGESAKFGLCSAEMIQAVRFLEKRGQKDCLKLFHFHAGSQIPDIQKIKESIREGTRIFAKLQKMGLQIDYLDVGGGLGVDYDGSRTSIESSMNYNQKQYVSDVVYIIQQICQEEKISEPNICSESGRAVVAHHSCLILEVFGEVEKVSGFKDNSSNASNGSSDGHSRWVREMREIFEYLKPETAMEAYQDAVAVKEDVYSAFKHGIAELEDRAHVESLFWELSRQLVNFYESADQAPEEIRELRQRLSSQYLANFSLFQTAPDHWAFDQIFPVLPLHRHKEPPTSSVSLVDITCDSDGKLKSYVSSDSIRDTIALHPLKKDKPYLIGIFMLGAYQDVMGDMHNCFGRVNEVHVYTDDDDPEDFYVEEIIRGQTVGEVLEEHQYSPRALIRAFKSEIDRRINEGKIKPREGVRLVNLYEETLKGYTYLGSRHFD